MTARPPFLSNHQIVCEVLHKSSIVYRILSGHIYIYIYIPYIHAEMINITYVFQTVHTLKHTCFKQLYILQRTNLMATGQASHHEVNKVINIAHQKKQRNICKRFNNNFNFSSTTCRFRQKDAVKTMGHCGEWGSTGSFDQGGPKTWILLRLKNKRRSDLSP